jgi:subtilase family serine protease
MGLIDRNAGAVRARALWTVAALGAGLLGAASAGAAPRPILSAHVPDAVASHVAPRVGAPAPGARMHLAVALSLPGAAALDAFLADIYNPASPNFRRYLSVADFTKRFGPTAASYRQAADFFSAQGLTATAGAPNRVLIDVDGSVADIQRVFHVTIGLYRHPTQDRLFMAPDREPTLDLSVPVLHVTGLDTYQLPRPRLVRQAAVRAGTGSGPGGAFIGSDARTAYYGGGTLNGSGQSLGLMELGGYDIADVKAYFAKFGPPLAVNVVGISTDGASLSCAKGCDDSEQVLDIEYSIAMAPGLKQVQVYVGKNAEDVLSRMASDDTSLQLSTSWGWSVKEFPTDDPLLKEMAAQGQSFLTASGDYSSLQASGPWPEEDANLTAVGGTDLVTKGAGGAWSSETGWSGSAGGPSVDKAIKIESYQLPFITTANKGSKILRNVPDIAAIANNFYICSDGKCDGGWAGTSFASPIWTGFVALANQQAAAAGKPPVGLLNPTLYALAGGGNYTSLLHDITKGTSGKFSCTPIYDLVTGLGSPNGATLIDALAGGS